MVTVLLPTWPAIVVRETIVTMVTTNRLLPQVGFVNLVKLWVYWLVLHIDKMRSYMYIYY